MACLSFAAELAEMCYWADDESEENEYLLTEQRNGGDQYQSHRFAGGMCTHDPCNMMCHQRPQPADYRDGIPILVVEPFRKGTQKQLTVTNRNIEERPVVRSHMILDEYIFPCFESPSSITSLPASKEMCPYAWLRFSVNCGSIQQLAEHRERHQVRIVHLYGLAKLEFEPKVKAFEAKVEHDSLVPPERWEKEVLYLNMSKKGASPGEWRLLKLFPSAYRENNRCILYEAGRGIRGAEVEIPGAGRKSVEGLQQHLYQAVFAVYRKYGTSVPCKFVAHSGLQDSTHKRCRECAAVNISPLDCIARVPCQRCDDKDIRCVPTLEKIPAGRDILRRTVLCVAAWGHLPRRASLR